MFFLRSMYDWMVDLSGHFFFFSPNSVEFMDLCYFRQFCSTSGALPVYMGCDVYHFSKKNYCYIHIKKSVEGVASI